jgi:hypothetical protein
MPAGVLKLTVTLLPCATVTLPAAWHVPPWQTATEVLPP